MIAVTAIFQGAGNLLVISILLYKFTRIIDKGSERDLSSSFAIPSILGAFFGRSDFLLCSWRIAAEPAG
jgi:hypothetical protein